MMISAEGAINLNVISSHVTMSLLYIHRVYETYMTVHLWKWVGGRRRDSGPLPLVQIYLFLWKNLVEY